MKLFNFFIIVLISITSCNRESQNVYLYNVPMENGTLMLNDYTKLNGDAIEGHSFSRMSNNSQFGGGISINIPDSFLLKRTKVNFEAKVRSSILQTQGSIIISLGKDDIPVSWNNFMMAGTILNPNEWTSIKDSIEFPKRVNNKVYNNISVFGFVGNSNELFDLDDLKIKISYY